MKRTYVSWDDFSPSPFGEIIANKQTGDILCDDIVCLDTETSHNHDENNPIGWVYQWAFTYKDLIVYGRKPSQLVEAFMKIIEANDLYGGVEKPKKRLVIYIHNMSYDYSYIKEWLRDAFDTYTERMLATSKHKLITYEISGLYFKCSYRLSLKGLDSWAKGLGTVHKKLVGTIDYDVIRYQDSPLNKKDWKYMFYDVIVLDEAVRKQFAIYGDDVKTVPLTSTGYVRRETKKEAEKEKKNRYVFLDSQLDEDTYNMCRSAFAGGLTHGNSLMEGDIQEGCIRHRDFVSHYPSQQRCYSAPVSKFSTYFDHTQNDGVMSLVELIEVSQKKCILATIRFENMVLRQGVTLPYAQESKFHDGKLGKIDLISSNGRIVKMKGEAVVVVNEHDLKWLCKQYLFGYTILNVKTASRGKFPQYLINVIDRYFILKSECKKIIGDLEAKGIDSYKYPEYVEARLNETIAKGMLNGIYGMSATDLIRNVIYETLEGEWVDEKPTDISGELYEYYGKWGSFMAYQLGVWTTSNARNQLMEFVELVGYENFIYADTDSIFYHSTPEIEARIEARNQELREEGDKKGWFVEVDGKKIRYNQFTLEHEDIVRFKYLHSKCYAYEVKKGDKIQLKVTIAGVRRKGKKGTREEELGTIEELEHGKIFTDCGGTIVKHIFHTPTEEYINGHLTEYASCDIISNVTKTLNAGMLRFEEDMWWSPADNL